MPNYTFTSDWMDWGTYKELVHSTGGIPYKATHTAPQYSYPHDISDAEISAAFADVDGRLDGPNPPNDTPHHSGWPPSLDWYSATTQPSPSKLWLDEHRYLAGCSTHQMRMNYYAPEVYDDFRLSEAKIGHYGLYNPLTFNLAEDAFNPYQIPANPANGFLRPWPTMISPVTGNVLNSYTYEFQYPLATVLSCKLQTTKFGRTTANMTNPPQPIITGSREATFRVGHSPNTVWNKWDKTYYSGGYNWYPGGHAPMSGWKPQDSLNWTQLGTQTIDGTPTTPYWEGPYIEYEVSQYLEEDPLVPGSQILEFTNTYTGTVSRGSYLKTPGVYQTPISWEVSTRVAYILWEFQYPPVRFTYYENVYVPPPESTASYWGMDL